MEKLSDLPSVFDLLAQSSAPHATYIHFFTFLSDLLDFTPEVREETGREGCSQPCYSKEMG